MNDHALPHLREIILFLGLAGILIPLLKRYRVNPVLGFLIGGMLLGPHGLGALAHQSALLALFTFAKLDIVDIFSEIGVIFLLFTIGLHLSLRRLWNLRHWVFGAGVAQMLFSILLIGGTLIFMGYFFKSALLVATVLSFSSTAIVMQLMQQNAQTNTPMGRSVFSILLLQDLAVVPALLLFDSMAGTEGNLMMAVVFAALKAILAFTAIYWLGKKGVRPLFHYFADTKEPESFVALILLTTLGIAAITWFAGLSMALGALLAGLLLAETEFRHEIEIIIKPFSSLLMGLFFFSMGMNINLPGIVEQPILLPLLAILLYLIKSIIIGTILRLFGLSFGAALEGGVLLGQGSEFAFIILTVATSKLIFDRSLSESIAIVLSITLLMTPIVTSVAYRLHHYFRHRNLIKKAHQVSHGSNIHLNSPKDAQAFSIPVSDLRDHIVILGYGRVGQVLGKLLYQNAIPFVAIDSNARHSTFFHKHGLPVYFGNDQNPETLRVFNLDRALCVVLTMSDKTGSLQTVNLIRQHYPSLPIFARAHDEAHAQSLLTAGVQEIILETFEASLQLTQVVLRESGIGLEKLQEIVSKERNSRIEGIIPPKSEKTGEG